jgi:predicted acyltransferase (DUF342 family)
MKLSLSVLKKSLISEGLCDEDWEVKNNNYIKNNISDEDVSVEEFISIYKNYWNEMDEYSGDSSELLEDILKDDYKLSDEDIEKVMDVYEES